MPALYCIIGLKPGERDAQINVLWPVAFRHTPEEADQIKRLCEEQRDRFLNELKPVLRDIEQHDALEGVGHKKLSVSARRNAETKWALTKKVLRMREAEINAKFAPEMFDPLYPTSTNGVEPDFIAYRVLPFWDDPREMGELELMRMRVRLHGVDDVNDPYDPDDHDF